MIQRSLLLSAFVLLSSIIGGAPIAFAATVDPTSFVSDLGSRALAQLPNEDTAAARQERFRQLFTRYDVILSVTAQRIAAPVEQWERAWTIDGPTFPGGSFAPVYCSHTMIFNWLGFPAVSVPCGCSS